MISPFAFNRLLRGRGLLTRSKIIVFLGLLSPPFASHTNANLIPSSWSISAGIQQTGQNGFTEQVVDSSHTVQVPLANFSQSAILGPSLSTAQYAFNIGQTVANYVVNVQHRCVNSQNGDFNANPRCLSFGRIILTPSVDVLLSAAIDYSYFLPTDPVSVNLGVQASVAEPFEGLMLMTHFDTTTLSGPHAGLFSDQESVILPAGRTATIQYDLRLFYSPTSSLGLLASGDGNIHLTMTALPEPAAFGPLAFLALFIHARRTHRLRA